MEQLIWRPWRDVARELAVESDPYRILELCNELTAAAVAQGSALEGWQEKQQLLPTSRLDRNLGKDTR
jgi:hypothetical protein